jgi:ABC-type multidrug transport system ATPase subunit
MVPKSIEITTNNSTGNNHNNNGILASNLTKIYGNFRAVDSLTLDVNAGDIFGFLGPNGAGKTTTIRMLCGLLSPTSGKAVVAGFDVRRESMKIRSIIGLLPESSGFYHWMNAEEYLLHFAELYKIEPQLAKETVKDLLEKVGLGDKSFVPIGYYSRGMKQRLGLARTLINSPQIIFLDEPTLGLDPKGQQEIRKILLDLNRDKGITIFLCSHTLSEVSSLCNRIAIINRGRLVAQGTIDELRKLAGGGSSGLVVRVLNLPTAQKSLSDLPFRINATIDNKLINVAILEFSESVNAIIQSFEKAGFQIYDIKRFEMSLEDIFFKLTGSKIQHDSLSLEQKSNGGKYHHA